MRFSFVISRCKRFIGRECSFAATSDAHRCQRVGSEEQLGKGAAERAPPPARQRGLPVSACSSQGLPCICGRLYGVLLYSETVLAGIETALARASYTKSVAAGLTDRR